MDHVRRVYSSLAESLEEAAQESRAAGEIGTARRIEDRRLGALTMVQALNASFGAARRAASPAPVSEP
jgi:hypothetical protein